MSQTLMDIPAFVREIYNKRSSLQKDLAEVERVIYGLESLLTSAAAIVSPQYEDLKTDTSTLVYSYADHEGKPVSGETITQRIVGLLDVNPQSRYTPTEIAKLLDLTSDDVNGRTSYLVKNKRVLKVGRGLYQSIHAPKTA